MKPLDQSGHVFLSYSKSDKDEAKRFYDYLKNEGLYPWMDSQSINPGERWDPAIKMAIDSAYCIVICVSSVGLKNATYLHTELELISDLLKKSPTSRIDESCVFILCLDQFDVSKAPFPVELKNRQSVASGNGAFLEAMLEVRSALNRRDVGWEPITLRDRIQKLIGLMEHDREHVAYITEHSDISRSSLQRYLKGDTRLRLNRVGKLLAAVRQYFSEQQPDAPWFDMRLLEPAAIARGMPAEDIRRLGVRGPEALVAHLNRGAGKGRDFPVDFQPATNEIIEAYEKSDIFTKQLYIPLSAGTHGGDDVGAADAKICEFASGEQRVLFLYGDLGTGKSTTLRRVAYVLARRHEKAPESSRVPVFISLRKFNKAVSLEDMLVSHFTGHKKEGDENRKGDDRIEQQLGLILEHPQEDIRHLQESGRLIFLLDGFDEMADRISTVEIDRNLEQIAQLVNRGNKVVVSCRTHHFRNDRDLRAACARVRPGDPHLNGNGSLLFLQPFTRDNWNLYLRSALGEQEAAGYMRKLKAIEDYETLLRHPLLLEMTTKVLPQLADRDSFSRLDLFEHYVTRWFKREEWRSCLSPEQRRLLGEEIAWAGFSHDDYRIHFSQLGHMASSFFSDNKEKGEREIDFLQNELATASFLNRDDDGEYNFITPAFQFYFLALAMQRRINEDRSEGIGRQPIRQEVVELLADLEIDTSTLLKWCHLTTRPEWEPTVTGPLLRENARAILVRVQPIHPDQVDKLGGLRRRKEFLDDEQLSRIANEALPGLDPPVLAIDIFECYTQDWIGEQTHEFGIPEGHLWLCFEELAWLHHLGGGRPVHEEPLAKHIAISAGNGGERPGTPQVMSRLRECELLTVGPEGYEFRVEFVRNYFLARAVARRISIDSPHEVGRHKLPDHALDMLVELRDAADKANWDATLGRWLVSTREPADGDALGRYYLGTNAACLLRLQEKIEAPAHGERPIFQQLDLGGVEMPKADLAGIDLEGASLAGTDLSGTDLRRANLRGADLGGAKLNNARLDSVDLIDAKLHGVDLSGCDLTTAYVDRCDFTSAILHGAKWDPSKGSDVIWPEQDSTKE